MQFNTRGIEDFSRVTYESFNVFCRRLPHSTYVTQWGGSHVWKVGGKVFAIGSWNNAGVGITFKVGKIAFEVLKDMPGLRPAPYMASRGMSRIQHHGALGLPDEELLDRVRVSYDLAVEKLSGSVRAALQIG